MKKRYTVLGLSVVLALALAVPALGGPSNPVASISASVKSTANKALKKAKAAQTAANNAQATANSASSAAGEAQKDANTAGTTAKAAQTAANTALSTANTAKSAADSAKTAAAAAQASANSAKATADTALATANSKMSGEVHVEGEEGAGVSFANCPTGKVPTGGGYIITGANNNAATPIESTQYGNSWLVIAEQIEGTAGASWGTVATVNCATSP